MIASSTTRCSNKNVLMSFGGCPPASIYKMEPAGTSAGSARKKPAGSFAGPTFQQFLVIETSSFLLFDNAFIKQSVWWPSTKCFTPFARHYSELLLYYTL